MAEATAVPDQTACRVTPNDLLDKIVVRDLVEFLAEALEP